MLVLVSYDVQTTTPAGRRRLRRVAKACQDWGQRVRFSVFECEVQPAQWTALRGRLLGEIDAELDSLRFYFLGAGGRQRIEHVGAKPAYDPAGPLIV
jgi:CRISPR-associated protein Cas2